MFGVRVFSYLSEIKINVDCARTEDRRDSRVQYLRFLSGPGVDPVCVSLFAAVPLHRHYRLELEQRKSATHDTGRGTPSTVPRRGARQ